MLFTVALLVVAAWLYSKYCHTYWAARGVVTIPGYIPFLGHSHKLFRTSYPRWLYIDEVYKNLTGSKFCGYYDQLTPTLMLMDPELVKTILIKDFNHFADRRNFGMTSKRDETVKEMLSFSNGDHWKRIRSVLSPIFNSSRIKGIFPLVALKADALVDYIHREIKSHSALPLRKTFALYTLEVISSCAFGVETNSFQGEEQIINDMADKLLNVSGSRFRNMKTLLFFLFPRSCSFFKISFSPPEIVFFENVIMETMKQREKGGKRGDFLDLMMEAREDQKDPDLKAPKYPLKDVTIVAESILFIIVGYDTTATTLSFIAFLLAQYPEQQQRLRQELKNIVKEYGTLTYQGIMQAKFLDACISEALRLHPTINFVERICTKDYNDRHIEYLKDGMRFALMEVKLALAKILLDFEVSCAPGQEQMEFAKSFGSMRPSPDMKIVFKPLINCEQ
ncbi:Cytochrome P450 3A11-like 1 [Homarus americanus]|uniref:Cytochrome P450 3A11-like 1 n=1 Tax=Homarus americanus TaxID=6706 RepID=A0A8J5JLI3_HOMAM|nr:Cytochrome P450 3A11-like 1 [Homarus americanus]